MTEDDFKSALRSVATNHLPPPPSAHDIARLLLRRDRRLTRALAFLSLTFWLLGTAGLLWLVFALNRFVIFLRIAPGLPWSRPYPGQLPDPWTPSDYMFYGTNLIHHSTPYIAAAIACLVLAALFTVLLISTSRQATLNRINLSLAEIAEHLKRAGLTPPPTSASSLLDPQSQSGSKTPGERNSMRPHLLLLSLLTTAALAGTLTHAANRTPRRPATTRPWQGYPKLSPFTAVRYPTPTTIEIQLPTDPTWYQLLSLNALPTNDLISLCQSLDKKDWQKRFEEDLIEVLTRTGHAPATLDTATLELTDPTTHETTTQQAPLTESNRWTLWQSRHPHPTTRP